MKIKQFFCWHKNLTGLDAYIKKEEYSPYFTTTGYKEPIVILECDRCKKKFEMPLMDMQHSRHELRFGVDTTKLEKYTFFGGKEEVKEK